MKYTLSIISCLISLFTINIVSYAQEDAMNRPVDFIREQWREKHALISLELQKNLLTGMTEEGLADALVLHAKGLMAVLEENSVKDATSLGFIFCGWMQTYPEINHAQIAANLVDVVDTESKMGLAVRIYEDNTGAGNDLGDLRKIDPDTFDRISRMFRGIKERK